MTVVIADHSGRLGAWIGWAARQGSAGEAIDAIRRERPEVALVHADLPPEGGVALAGRIIALGPAVVLALATPDAGRLAAAFRVGVRVAVDVGAPPALLREALDAAVRGDLFVGPGLRGAFDAVLAHGGADPFPQLSGREREVLAQLASGADAGRVATRLGLAPKTVRHHLGSIRRKLGVLDHAEAARLARGAGLCIDDPPAR